MNIIGIVTALSLLPIIALLYSMQPFIVIDNQRITKFTSGGKNNTPELQINIMENQKGDCKEKFN